MSISTKSKLSATVLGVVLAGAPASIILDHYLDEREGNRLSAYRDGQGKPTICRGITYIDGKPVLMGMRLTAAQCDKLNQKESAAAIAWVERNVHVPLTEPQKAGIASFCPYNIGPAKCLPSTFYYKLNAGDRKGACAEIKRWIRDGGKDCRIRSNNCYGQIERRAQESELTCWGLDE
ncbi:TPA: lysozyme [Yersinia enterocolitica]|uniref:lysozyme n=1 Tax=Yersinia TaxID=629 RepID=UPI0003D80528|nr:MULTISPECIES: lysozyme [Yersinia]AKF38547.1 lysozyme [Yersinia enterocolitica]ALG44870.1 lysozyme [Yersinia enterocolitica]EKN3341714.1 lysozyme [Yersinia enterocolitica]EKN3404536.1 lysozyme [Yersinia enterocolitica]EKN3527328.1 lysozyme [Yersinia enterocolitica]